MEKEGERERESRKFNVKSNAHFSSYFYARIVFFCLCVYLPSSLHSFAREKSNTNEKRVRFSLELRSFACLTERKSAKRNEEETFEFTRTHHACLCLQGSPREGTWRLCLITLYRRL